MPKFTGGKFGYKSISIKPSGEPSVLLDYHLAILRKVVGSSLVGKVAANWPNTLVESEIGTQLLELMQAQRDIEKQMRKLLDSVYDKDNEMAFAIANQAEVGKLTDDLLGGLGLDGEDEADIAKL
jgi:hypothetical protein